MTLQQKDLYQAIQNGSANCVKSLIDSGTNVNETLNGKGTTPLMLAVSLGQFGIMPLLIKVGHADVNIADKNGQTALMLAAQKEDTRFIKYLLKSNADTHAQDANSQNALIIALKHKKEKNTHILINTSPKLKTRDKDGNNAIMYAVKAGLLTVAQKLEAGQKIGSWSAVNTVNNAGQSPLMIAAQNDDEPMVDWLLSVGAHVYAQDKEYKRPVNYARKGSKIYKKLKALGIEADKKRRNTAHTLSITQATERSMVK